MIYTLLQQDMSLIDTEDGEDESNDLAAKAHN